MKAILLTGVSGGIGFEVAKKFLSEDYVVFGLDIKPPKETLENLIYIETDITKEGSIQNAFNIVKNSGYELTTIISTAGIYELNSLIEMKEADFIKVFDVNVFSIYRINKTFFPLLANKGKIIMISSELAPLDPLPFTGIYAISKTLVEQYAFSLRMEVQLLGHQVVLIRPGAIDTGLIDVSLEKLNKFTEETTYYKCNSKKFKDIVNSVESKKIHPSKVAKLIYKVNRKKKPRYVYKINRNPGLLLLNALPKRTQNWIIKKILMTKKQKMS